MNKLPIILVIVIVIFAIGWIFIPNLLEKNTNTYLEVTVPGNTSVLDNSTHNVKTTQAIVVARGVLAEKLSLENPESVLILEAHEREWSNACLGLEKEGQFCAQVITPGYTIAMRYKEVIYFYRTNSTGSLVVYEAEGSIDNSL